ncbi:MAG: 6,7-dimethyl-8-ribityllumazine synthase [SAR202 cluster bacterium]|nr:6,7-dimethyl-8-ribityllumazine synthase [Myxococcales bacterium]MQG87977.1 6,7-dimethyl-8-ribityllumazine synthase [SAR202 cluster bacterium]|tara:strand:+ start:596 stop:1057 length:462 start_codon:yes stop_codon:yes gene_type:complete
MSKRIIKQNLDGKGLGIAVLSARFNAYITRQMSETTINRLENLGVDKKDIIVSEVPGAFELPLMARILVGRSDIHAVICIGAIIRGETDHYDFVASAATNGIAQVSNDSKKPVIFGVLTTDNTDDAIARIGHATSYADTAVEMVNAVRQAKDI